MNHNMDPKPGSSKQPESDIRSIAGCLPDQFNQKSNKLESLTSEEVDKFISNETLAQYEYSGDRHLLIYDRNQIEEISPVNSEEPEDEFFELSTGEAKKLLRDIIRTRDQLENGQLMTKAMRDFNSAKRTLATLHQYNYSVVRLYLPDGIVLQALFKPLENVDKIKTYFQQFLENPDLDFYIYFSPPKTILQGPSTLLDLHCVPTANFYFGVNEPCPTLELNSQIEQDSKNHQPEVVANKTNCLNKTPSETEAVKFCPNESLSKQEQIEIRNSDSSVMKTPDTAQASSNCFNETVTPACLIDEKKIGNCSNSVVKYVKPDVLGKYLVSRSVADAKAAEFRRAKNPALTFMDEPDPCALTQSLQSPQEQITPAASNLNRPRTSADKIPKWFRPGGK